MELKNKTVLFLGSSVTHGSAAGDVSFTDIMADICPLHSIKETVPGTALADVNSKSGSPNGLPLFFVYITSLCTCSVP